MRLLRLLLLTTLLSGLIGCSNCSLPHEGQQVHLPPIRPAVTQDQIFRLHTEDDWAGALVLILRLEADRHSLIFEGPWKESDGARWLTLYPSGR